MEKEHGKYVRRGNLRVEISTGDLPNASGILITLP
jgi:hypothetical protein